jgi:hypothetical protein
MQLPHPTDLYLHAEQRSTDCDDNTDPTPISPLTSPSPPGKETCCQMRSFCFMSVVPADETWQILSKSLLILHDRAAITSEAI